MHRSLKVWLVLAAILSLISCEEPNSATYDPRYQVAIDYVTSLQISIAKEETLSKASRKDINCAKDMLSEIQMGLIRLQRNSGDRLGLELTTRGVMSFRSETCHILKRDLPKFEKLYRLVGPLIEDGAAQGKVDLDGLNWVLYRYRFSEDIKPFYAFATGLNWRTGWVQETSYIKVESKASHNDAWLIAPAFDLTGIEDPVLRFEHMIMINQSQPAPFDPRRIIDSAFKVRVSTNYEGGDPRLKKWKWSEPLDISPMPLGERFHTVLSPPIDLTPFRAKNVSIAFQFDVDAGQLGRHYITWQIQKFELSGRGRLGTPADRIEVVLEHNFDKPELAPFSTYLAEKESPNWHPFAFGKQYKYAKISIYETPADAWLISPPYKIGEDADDLTVSIKEVVRSVDLREARLLVSNSYKEGDDPALASWVELTRKDVSEIHENWTDLTSGPFSLKSFAGNNVVFAFHYRSSRKSDWEIENLIFTGRQGDIEEVEGSKDKWRMPFLEF